MRGRVGLSLEVSPGVLAGDASLGGTGDGEEGEEEDQGGDSEEVEHGCRVELLR